MAEMSAPPTTPESDWLAYLIAGTVALLGSIARAGRWVDETGKFSWTKFSIEIVTAFVIGTICVGAGVYWGLLLPVVGGVAGLAGLIGPAAIVGMIQEFIKRRFGGG